MIRMVLRTFILGVVLFAVGGLSGLGALYFFRGGEGVFLPHMVGQDVVRALEQLSERGVRLEVSGWTFSDKVPLNYVLSQLPAGGRRIRKDRTVSIVISRGARNVKIPTVVGEDLSRAETLIRLNGLRVGPVERVYNSRRRVDEVIGSWPHVGESTARGEQVVLLVSQGPQERAYAMPSLIGDEVNSALDKVRKVGLAVGRVRYVDREGARRGTVVVQIPQPGQRVLAGYRVHVDVARGARQIEGNFTVLRYRVPPGRPRRQLRIELEAGGEIKDVLSREVSAGEEINLLISAKGRTRARIYLDDELIEEQDH